MQIYSTKEDRTRNPTSVHIQKYVETTLWNRMKAKLLQHIKWFPRPYEKVGGIVVKIDQTQEFHGTRLVGFDPIEVYDVAFSDGRVEKAACCFLNLDCRLTVDVEELLTHAHKDIRQVGTLLHKHPELKAILDYEIGIGNPNLNTLVSHLILCTNPDAAKTHYKGTELENLV